jgi:pimeloyl-ACP methyl ester carboxylesterase
MAILLAAESIATAQSQTRPVAAVAEHRLTVSSLEGRGVVPIYLSRDWEAPLPGIKRAVIIVHGTLRNADVYLKSAEEAAAASGEEGAATLLVVPQFLAAPDIDAHQLGPDFLAWSLDGWKGGEPAERPAPVSAFSVFDAILARLADRRLFPGLTRVVVAGHSAGAQVVQRYAVVGHGEAPLATAGVAVRYVVANPSSYLYFNDDRPLEDGTIAPFAGAADCPIFDRWRYGLADAPAYVGEIDAARLEQRYVESDVVYLLGTEDTNPNHAVLDRSCAGMAQGPHRHARGIGYFRYLKQRNGASLQHRVVEVPGVGHDNRGMFTSACGLAVLFDRPGC